MSRSPRPAIRIDRLDLDLRGVPPQAAEAAVRLLGPALAAAFAREGGRTPRTIGALDAGAVAATDDPQALASRIAHRVAARTTTE